MRTALVSSAVMLAIGVAAPRARMQDYDAMAKWTDAKVIRWHVSGDFSGTVGIMGGLHVGRGAQVTDHVEFDFDWDNAEMTVIGKPVIKNFPTTMSVIVEPPLELYGKCPPAKIEGAYEHWTLQSVTSVTMMISLHAKTDTPGGAIPYSAGTNAACGSSWDTVAPGSRLVEGGFQVPPAMMLEMGMSGSEGEVSKDKKSFIVRPADQAGWVWTLTPTIVK